MAMKMEEHLVKVEYQQHLAIVFINRKDKLNALNDSLIEELMTTLSNLKKDEKVKAIIITGTEKSFVVGADVTQMKDLDSFSAVTFISKLQELLGMIRSLDKPVIAGVNGYCYGAGLELAISCDIVIASEDATFGMQEVKLGIPSVIEAALLPFVIGLLKTKELLLTGDVIQAEEAMEMRMVNHLVKRDDLMKVCIGFGNKLAAHEPHAVALQKRLINRWLENAGLEQSVNSGKEFFGLSFANEKTTQLLSSALKKETI